MADAIPSPTWVGWLADAAPAVQIVALVLAFSLVALVVWRAPSVADAIARVRGKGQTDREVELSAQVNALTRRVSELEMTLRQVIDHYEEWDAALGSMLPPPDDCMVPGCSMAQAVAFIAKARASRQPLPGIAPAE